MVIIERVTFLRTAMYVFWDSFLIMNAHKKTEVFFKDILFFNV